MSIDAFRLCFIPLKRRYPLPSMMRTLGIDHAPQNPTSMWIEPVDAKTFFVNAPTELALYMSDASQVHRMRRTTPEDAKVRLSTGDELLEYLREGLKAGPVLVDDGTRLLPAHGGSG